MGQDCCGFAERPKVELHKGTMRQTPLPAHQEQASQDIQAERDEALELSEKLKSERDKALQKVERLEKSVNSLKNKEEMLDQIAQKFEVGLADQFSDEVLFTPSSFPDKLQEVDE